MINPLAAGKEFYFEFLKIFLFESDVLEIIFYLFYMNKFT